MQFNYFNTIAYESNDVINQLSDIAEFLIKNRSVRIPTTEMDTFFKASSVESTFMNEVYKKILDSRKTDLIAGLNFGNQKNISVPETLTLEQLVLDVLQMGDVNSGAREAINSYPEYKDRIILNITPYLTQRDPIALKHTRTFRSHIVKAMLYRNYFTSTNSWLTPKLVSYLAKSYSMIFATMIARSSGLNDYSQKIVIATILAIQYYQMCQDSTKIKELPPELLNANYLGNRIAIKDTFNKIEDLLEGDLLITKEKVVELIQQMLPERMSKYTLREFTTTIITINTNQPFQSYLCMEYAPQWAHMILSGLSGLNKKVAVELKQVLNDKKESVLFVNELISSNKFIPQL